MKDFLSRKISIEERLSLMELIRYLKIPIEKGNKIKSVFNDEETASMLINTKGKHKNKFKDFSSGNYGGVFEFYLQYINKKKKVTDNEAILQLEGIINELKVEPKNKKESKINMRKKEFKFDSEKRIYEKVVAAYSKNVDIDKKEVRKTAVKFVTILRRQKNTQIYDFVMSHCELPTEHKEAYRYLTGKKRNLSKIEIHKFHLEVLAKPNILKKKLLNAFSLEDLQISGLFRENNFIYNKPVILIPFFDINNHITSLSARKFRTEDITDKNQYIRLYNNVEDNSSSDIYNSNVLNQLKDGDKLYLAESEFDTMVMTRFKEKCIGFRGISNIPLTRLKKLESKYSLIFAFDNDVKSKAATKVLQKIANYIQKPINYIELTKFKDITELYGIDNSRLEKNKFVSFKVMQPQSRTTEISNQNAITILNATELQKMKFEDDVWYIEKILKPGLTIISGRPKDGKSRLVLNMAVCVVNGKTFLYKYVTAKTGVCFISFEENFRLIKKRISKMLQGKKFPENLVFPSTLVNVNGKLVQQTYFPKFDDGGLEQLEAFIKQNINYKVIIFDNIGKAYADRYNKRSYEEDYHTLAPLQELASKYNVCIIGLHHNRKQSAYNPIDEMMGSSSLAAVADTLIILRKVDSNMLDVNITGRDIEGREITISVNNENGIWREVKRKNKIRLTPKQEKIYSYFLKGRQFNFKTKHLELFTSYSKSSISIILNTLLKKKLIENVRYGVYRLAA